MKSPAIKEWSRFCSEMVTEEEATKWATAFTQSNIAVCTGSASKIIALDVDTVDQKILDLILPILPDSPVEKIGAKGFTRFFKFSGEHTQAIRFNGEVILEILADGKKTTLPPSRHPSGVDYTWSKGSLLDINVDDLPLFPPFLISNIESKLKLHFRGLDSSEKTAMISGRNNDLSKLCGTLIADRLSLDEAINKLVDYDTKNHTPPLFSDPSEMMCTDAVTNALVFYSNHLQSVNNRHYKKGEEYEVPVLPKQAEGTSLPKKASEKKLRILPPVSGVLKTIQSWILENSWVPQPSFAFSASLALMGTLASRKFIFQGSTTNLYLLNIAGSGSGKDFPQQSLKEILSLIHSDRLLGSGDYTSDASLMDSLASNPVRLDLMDEAGGILKSITSSKTEYGGKMADILAELYTTSTSKYLGRALSEGIKGSCYRPHVNILASTTPTGFSEGVTIRAIEKGLLGRFLIFFGNHDTPAKRVYAKTKLDMFTLDSLRFLAQYTPTEETLHVGDIPQLCDELDITKEANDRLTVYFEEFDTLRRNLKSSDVLLPIVARLYQQMVKIVMISAIANHKMVKPKISIQDVEFGYETILYYFDLIQDVVRNYIHDNKESAESSRLLKIIEDNQEISKPDLVRLTKFLDKKKRDALLLDLIDSGQISVYLRDNQTIIVYRG